MNEAQINRALVARIREVMLDSPVASVGAYLRRVLELFTPRRVRNVLWWHTFTGPDGSELINALYRALSLQHHVTYALALIGTILLARGRRSLHGMWSLIATFVLLHALVSDGSLRLAAPLYPLICLLAGYTLDRLRASTPQGPPATPRAPVLA